MRHQSNEGSGSYYGSSSQYPAPGTSSTASQGQWPVGYEQGGYGRQPGGAPGDYPGQQQPVKRTNGFAIASLISGVLCGFPLGLGLGIVGLLRSGRTGSGKVMSWIGIGLSVAWIAVGAAVVAPAVAKASDPGCVAAKSTISDWQDNPPDDPVAGAHQIAADLRSDAAKSNNAGARAAINKLAGDFQKLGDDLQKTLNDPSAVPDPAALQPPALEADASAVDAACGSVG
ncbi:MAG: hypothetical protein J2P15_20285 [Micromonosporaceae bacterium]|nr:hypothetical protein [Micromonosporaceae bacterium]